MRYRKLSPTGDFLFGNGLLDFWIDVPDAVAQAVQTRILLWLGEWFLNIDDGTPFMQGIIGKHSQATADATIQDRILNTTGVINIVNYASVIDPVTRKFSVTCTLNTTYGPTQVEVDNYANY